MAASSQTTAVETPAVDFDAFSGIIKANLPSELVIQILPISDYWFRQPRGQHAHIRRNGTQRWRIMEPPNTIEEFHVRHPPGQAPPRVPIRFWEENLAVRPGQAAVDLHEYRALRNLNDPVAKRVLGPNLTVRRLRQTSRQVADLTASVLRTFDMKCHIVGPGCPNFDVLPTVAKDILLRSSVVSIRPTYYVDINYTPFLSRLTGLKYIHLDALELWFDCSRRNFTAHDIHLGLYLGDEEAHRMIVDCVEPLMALPFRSRTDPMDHPTLPGEQLPPQNPILILRWFSITNDREGNGRELRILIGKYVDGDNSFMPQNRPFVMDVVHDFADGRDKEYYLWDEVLRRAKDFLDHAGHVTDIRQVLRRQRPIGLYELNNQGLGEWEAWRWFNPPLRLDVRSALAATYMLHAMTKEDWTAG